LAENVAFLTQLSDAYNTTPLSLTLSDSVSSLVRKRAIEQ